MNTLSSTTRNVMPVMDSYGINQAFPVVNDTKLPVGTLVTLNSSGQAVAVSAVTDIVAGVVIVSNTPENNNEVTIITKFRAIVWGRAEGAVVTGQLVQGKSLEAGLMNYIDADTNAVGICIKGGADNAEISIGLF